MAKYTFTYEHEDGSTATITGNKNSIYEIVEDFGYFLKASTFSEELVDRVLGYDETNNNV